MRELYELKEKLCKELKDFSKRGDINISQLEIIDKLAHSIKNIDKVLECYENEEYSGSSSYRRASYSDGNYGDRSYKGYSMDGYSRGNIVSELRALMQDAPDDKTKQEFQRFIRLMERM